VLYEMVTGQKAFEGNSYPSLLAAILSADPPPMALKPFTPAWLERLVRRCLAKDPENRWQSMRDVVLELRTPMVKAPPPDGQKRLAGSGRSRSPRWR
jgi:eukaryotic-like serine/threonine-protein kinase